MHTEMVHMAHIQYAYNTHKKTCKRKGKVNTAVEKDCKCPCSGHRLNENVILLDNPQLWFIMGILKSLSSCCPPVDYSTAGGGGGGERMEEERERREKRVATSPHTPYTIQVT